MQGARLYKVVPIDRRLRSVPSKGRVSGWLTRVDVLKIPGDTVVEENRTIVDMVGYYDDLAAQEAVQRALDQQNAASQGSSSQSQQRRGRGRPRTTPLPQRGGS